MRTLTRPGTYRPPRGGEPSRLREDGHWSTDGLVGYWPMNEGRGSVVQDVSGFGNHGTLTGIGWSGYSGGTAAGAFVGADVADRVSWADTTAHEFASGKSFSIMSELYTSGVTWPSGEEGVVVKGDTSTIPAWHIVVTDTGLVRFRLRDATGVQSAYSAASILNSWHTLVVVYDAAAATICVYADGVPGTAVGSIRPAAYGTNTSGMVFGHYWGGGYSGYVSSLSIYSRALSADEIAALYVAPDLPLWRPRMGISLAMLTPEAAAAAGLPLITSRTLGRIGPSLRGLR